ncbi:MAG: hypothetical protein QME71_03215 [Dehalococcoidia bacterium]|nr:hypothetical protein [Dehalococcoidia bacterium]
MKRFMLAACAVAAALVVLSVAEAQTPEPVSTVPETPAENLPTIAPLPTAQPTATFLGNAWVNARLSDEPVFAKIGDVVCGEARRFVPPGAYGSVYEVEVASADDRAGCGYEGATVTFLIGDRTANESGIWRSGQTTQLVLTVGPPFAQFFGTASVDPATTDLNDPQVVPYVNGLDCGYQLNPWQGAGSPFGYHVVVYSAEIKAGCATDGQEVSFKLVDKRTGEIAAEAMGRAIWYPLAFERDINLAFTRVPVAQIPVAGGDGGTGVTWAPVFAIGGLLILVGGIGGLLAIRRLVR